MTRTITKAIHCPSWCTDDHDDSAGIEDSHSVSLLGRAGGPAVSVGQTLEHDDEDSPVDIWLESTSEPLTPEQAREIAKALVQAAAIVEAHDTGVVRELVLTRTAPTPEQMLAADFKSALFPAGKETGPSFWGTPGVLADHAAHLSVVPIPRLLGELIVRLSVREDLSEQESALCAMARAALADPETPWFTYDGGSWALWLDLVPSAA